jgi:hypothetical protein
MDLFTVFDINIDEITPQDFVIRFENFPAFEKSYIELILGCESEIWLTTNVIEPSTDPRSEQKYYTICLIGYNYLTKKGENHLSQLSREEISKVLIDYCKEHPGFDLSSFEVFSKQLEAISRSSEKRGWLCALINVFSLGNGVEVICKAYSEHPDIFTAIREDIDRIFHRKVHIILEYLPEQSEESKQVKKTIRSKRIAPRRWGDLKKWIEVWKYCKAKGLTNIYKSNASGLYDRLKIEKKAQHYNGPLFSAETLKLILEAGFAGELEE